MKLIPAVTFTKCLTFILLLKTVGKKKSNKSKALPAYKVRKEIYNLAYLSHQGVQPDDEFWSFYSRKRTQISLYSSCTSSGEVT